MSPFILYLLKANALLVFFWLFYRLFLQKETFYTTLRWYFISSIVFSLSLPLFTFTKTIIIEQQVPFYDTNVTSDFLPKTALPTVEPSFWEHFDWQNAILYLLVFVSLWCLLQSAYRIVNLYIHIKCLPNFEGKSIKISNKQSSVYSFYQWIVVPENKLSCPDLEMILAHENVHLNQKHTLDLILIELVSAVFWFNPLLKMLQKDINTNLEFIVDEKMVMNFEPISYQKRLITEQSNHSLTYINAFNSKDLKKRIIQLNTQKSKNMKKLKFLVTAPVLAAFFVLFQVKTEAQVQTIQVQEVLPTDEKEDSFNVMIHNQYDDAYYQNLTKTFKEKYDLDVVIDDLERNKEGKLTSIKIGWDNNKRFHKSVGANNKGFDSFKLHVYKNNNNKYFIEKVSDDENTNSSIHYEVEVEAVIEKENDQNKLSFDAKTLKSDRKIFDHVAKKHPIVVDNIPLTKKQLKRFDNSKIQSMTWESDQTGKNKPIKLLLSTKRIAQGTYTNSDSKVLSANGKKVIIGSYNEQQNNHFTEVEKTQTITVSSSSGAEEKKDNTRVTLKDIGVNNNIVYILNGKEISSEDFGKTHPSNIQSINILKDQKTIEKYGDKAKDGVLIITTKSEKEVSSQKRNEALKTRELIAQKRQQLISEQKEQLVERKKEIEKQRQQLLAKKDEIQSKTESRKKELEKVRQEKHILKKEMTQKSETSSKEWNELKEIFNTMIDTKKDLEDEHTKITNISAKMTLEDGTEIKISENY